jgi:hypothetical protein
MRASDELATLDLFLGGQLILAPGSDATLDVTFSVFLNGLLDLNDNTMIARGLGPDFRQLLAIGWNGGEWNGTSGITSTFSANSAAADGIGYARAFELGRTEFNGTPISGADLVLDHTLYGDANLDHQITLADFNRLAGGFGQSGKFWANGDFDYDGTVGLPDFNRLAGNFGQTIAANGLPALPGVSSQLAELS